MMMLNDVIKDLNKVLMEQGNIFIGTQTQVGKIVDVRIRVDNLCLDGKPTDLKVAVIEGYVK